ncbi:MAG: four helix bundle protein [Legionella sp.]|uniref:four helix bundle protein n=1 Tax=Legionella sp. TaxID=459 RepID=UPI0039E44BEE
MQYFDHEKLDVYQKAIEFVALIESIVKQFPKGRAYLIDQLQRAGSSVVLNIAEGAGEFSMNEKIRFYRMARRSATECVGILDICMHFNLIDENISLKSRNLLLRIVSMLTKMARITSGTQAGRQTFT